MERLPELITLAMAIHGLAVAIVNLTPTPKDDRALRGFTTSGVKLYRAIEILAGIWTPLVKK